MWNQRHLMIVLREYEDFYNAHRPHRALTQAALLRPLPDGITDLDQFRVQRRDRAGGVSTNIAWSRKFSAPTTGRTSRGGNGHPIRTSRSSCRLTRRYSAGRYSAA